MKKRNELMQVYENNERGYIVKIIWGANTQEKEIEEDLKRTRMLHSQKQY